MLRYLHLLTGVTRMMVLFCAYRERSRRTSINMVTNISDLFLLLSAVLKNLLGGQKHSQLWASVGTSCIGSVTKTMFHDPGWLGG